MTPEEIKALRARLGLSPTNFAARVGVTMRAVYAWEAGERTPGGPARMLMEKMAARKVQTGTKAKPKPGDDG